MSTVNPIECFLSEKGFCRAEGTASDERMGKATMFVAAGVGEAC